MYTTSALVPQTKFIATSQPYRRPSPLHDEFFRRKIETLRRMTFSCPRSTKPPLVTKHLLFDSSVYARVPIPLKVFQLSTTADRRVESSSVVDLCPLLTNPATSLTPNLKSPYHTITITITITNTLSTCASLAGTCPYGEKMVKPPVAKIVSPLFPRHVPT